MVRTVRCPDGRALLEGRSVDQTPRAIETHSIRSVFPAHKAHFRTPKPST